MSTIEKRNLGKTGYQATFLGFGALEIGRNWGLGSGKEVERPSEEIAGQALNAVLDVGINLVDTASAYHASEERIGKFISHRRSEYILASKCGEHNREPDTYYDFSYQAIKDSIDRSLNLLKTDCIDQRQEILMCAKGFGVVPACNLMGTIKISIHYTHHIHR